MDKITIDGITYRLVKDRTTCKDCANFDYCDMHAVNKHPNKASWSHLCIAKNIQKYASDSACKQYFVEK